MSIEREKLSKAFAKSGAWLFAVGLFTGIWSAAALTGVVVVKIPHLALAAHLNGLLGGLWILAVAFTAPWLGFQLAGLRRLYALINIACWGNWLITLIASVVGVTGLNFVGELKNDSVAVLLQIFVVLPSLVGAGVWVRGFYIPIQLEPKRGDINL